MSSTTFDSQILREIPSIISHEDRERVVQSTSTDTTPTMQSKILLYEEIMERYPSESHPFFLVLLAEIFIFMGSGPFAVLFYAKAQDILTGIGVSDNKLDTIVQDLTTRFNEQTNKSLTKSRRLSYFHKWKPTRDHKFPTNVPHLPQGSQKLLGQWQNLTSGADPTFHSAYLRRLAIESNHVESVFLISEGSTQDLVRHGVDEGTVTCLPDSAIKDPNEIKSILNDMLAVYELLPLLANDMDGLDKDTICQMHARFMKTSRFSDDYCIPTGKTRTETRSTVVISGIYAIESCPFPEVDAEVMYIFRMALQWIRSWRNPFSTASWLHLVLINCHPFDDGNGRLSRLLASIPLLRHGYPPISISLTQRADYYSAMNKAREGDHGPLVQCILQGMQEAMESVQSLNL